jgi:hypothetical protein
MLSSFMSRFLPKRDSKASSLKDSRTRRAYVRYNTDRGVATIRGRTFRVMNWSFGGIAIASGDAIFIEGQPFAMDLKFKLSKSDLDIAPPGIVVRSDNQITAFRFAPLNQMIISRFQKVIEYERECQLSNPKSK